MQIVCPHCSTGYELSDAVVAAHAGEVSQCSNCQKFFRLPRITPPLAPAPPREAAPAPPPPPSPPPAPAPTAPSPPLPPPPLSVANPPPIPSFLQPSESERAPAPKPSLEERAADLSKAQAAQESLVETAQEEGPVVPAVPNKNLDNLFGEINMVIESAEKNSARPDDEGDGTDFQFQGDKIPHKSQVSQEDFEDPPQEEPSVEQEEAENVSQGALDTPANDQQDWDSKEDEDTPPQEDREGDTAKDLAAEEKRQKKKRLLQEKELEGKRKVLEREKQRFLKEEARQERKKRTEAFFAGIKEKVFAYLSPARLFGLAKLLIFYSLKLSLNGVLVVTALSVVTLALFRYKGDVIRTLFPIFEASRQKISSIFPFYGEILENIDGFLWNSDTIDGKVTPENLTVPAFVRQRQGILGMGEEGGVTLENLLDRPLRKKILSYSSSLKIDDVSGRFINVGEKQVMVVYFSLSNESNGTIRLPKIIVRITNPAGDVIAEKQIAVIQEEVQAREKIFLSTELDNQNNWDNNESISVVFEQ